MNILFCDPVRLGELRGLFAHIYEVSSNLTKLGHNIVLLKVIQPNKQPSPLWARIDRLSHRLPLIGTAISEIYTFFLILRAIIRHSGWLDVIYRRDNLINSECLLSKLFKIPWVIEVNGFEAGEGSSVRTRILARIERFTMHKADRVIVVTSRLKKLLPLDYGIPEEKIVVIENGANVDLFKPMDVLRARAELNLSQSDHYICLVGSNLLPYQGAGRLIRTAPFLLERFPCTRFLIVGGTIDSIRRELIDTAEKAGLGDKFTFTGPVPYQQVPLYINASDVCVILPKGFSRRSGASPLRLCEYMACEKPVVASRMDGLEILEENNTGLLVDSENPRGIAGAIAKLLGSKELRTEMGRNGRGYVVANRSWAIVGKRTAQVCQEAVDEHRKRTQQKKGK